MEARTSPMEEKGVKDANSHMEGRDETQWGLIDKQFPYMLMEFSARI